MSSRMWVAAALYFFQFVAVGVYFTFLNVYLKTMGLSGAEIGLIGMTTGITSMAGTFAWGYLSDRTGQPRWLLAMAAVGALLAAQLLPLVDTWDLQPMFAWYVVINGVVGLMYAALSTLIDSTAVAMLGGHRQKYGRYRLGGSLGFIVGGMASGYIYDQVGYGWMFPLFAVVMVVFAGFALLLPARVVRLASSGGREIGRMVRQPEWLLLIASLFLFWAGYNISFVFNGVILKAMGGSDQLISWASVIGTIVEIPFMAFSGRLIQRYGPTRLLALGLLLQTIRFVLLAQMRDPVWAVAFNMLNGPGYVLFWNSAVYLVARMAPPGLGATAQGFLTSALNLAGITSSALSGVVYDQFGSSGLYWVVAAFCLASLVLFGVGFLWRRPSWVAADI